MLLLKKKMIYYNYIFVLQAGLPWARPSSGEERHGSGVQEGAGVRPLGDWLRQAGAGCQVRHTFPSVAGPGCLSRVQIFSIPDPNFFRPRCQILFKKFKYVNQRKFIHWKKTKLIFAFAGIGTKRKSCAASACRFPPPPPKESFPNLSPHLFRRGWQGFCRYYYCY